MRLSRILADKPASGACYREPPRKVSIDAITTSFFLVNFCHLRGVVVTEPMFWRTLGSFWDPFGRLGLPRGSPWRHFGLLLAPLGCRWAPLGHLGLPSGAWDDFGSKWTSFSVNIWSVCDACA